MAAKSQDRAIMSVKKRIVPVSESAPYVKLLVYGKNGRGKTRFAASAKNKTLILDVNEKGTRSVRDTDCDVFHVNKWEDARYVYWYLRNGDHPYGTVVVDTLTQLQHMCMSHVLERAEDRDPNRPPSMPDRRTWGQLAEHMKPLILDFRNLPMHVVFVCQVRRDSSDDEDSPGGWCPDLSPSVRGVAMGAVEVMGYIFRKETRVVKEVKGKKRTVAGWQTMMLVGDHDEYETKDRTGTLPRVLVNPTMEAVIKASFEEE